MNPQLHRRTRKLEVVSRMIGFFLVLVLALGAPAAQAEVSAEATLGLRSVTDKNQSFRFNEYRDIGDGFYGSAFGTYESPNYFVDLTAANIALDDQFYEARGGLYQGLKYSIFYNEIPHQLSLNNKTFYSGVGTGTLTFTPTAATAPAFPLNPNTWALFDYRMKIKDFGITADVGFYRPFFLNVFADRITTKGLRPQGFNQGTPGGVFVELPETMDYQNNVAGVEGGYQQGPVFASLRYYLSAFNNRYAYWNYRLQNWPTVSQLDTVSGAPGNLYQKWTLTSAYSGLPLDSTLAFRGDISTIKNDVTLPTQAVRIAGSGVPGFDALTIRNAENGQPDGTYGGDLIYKTVNVSLASRPSPSVDTKLYYTFLQKKNRSEQLLFTVGANTVESETFGYRKNDAGLDLGFRLPGRTKLLASYEFLRIDRQNREDAIQTTDRIYSFKLRNSYLDWVAPYFRFRQIYRTSINGHADDTAGAEAILRYFRRYDATDKKQNSYEVGVDVTPLENLTLSAEYAYRRNDYSAAVLGVSEDSVQAAYIHAGYEVPELAKFNVFYGVESTKVDSNHRRFVNAPDFNPALPPSATAYNWSKIYDDKTFNWGVGLEVPVLRDRLNWITSLQQVVANGRYDITLQPGAPAAAAPVASNGNINGTSMLVDDYRRSIFDTKAVYRIDERFSAGVGFIWDQLRYEDDEFQGYRYAFGAGPALNSVTGAYLDQTYLARVYYIEGTYRF